VILLKGNFSLLSQYLGLLNIYVKKFLIIIGLFFGSIAIGSCSVTDVSEGNSCILSEIQFTSNTKLVFTTISGGQVYQLKQEFTDEDGEVITLASFQYQYFTDSLVVRNQLATSRKFPFMTVKFEEGRAKRVQKFFGGSGVRLIHEIDYSNDDLILIDLYREASDGRILYAGYSNYYTDEKGNITRNVRYLVDRQDPSIFSKFEDTTFEYDDYSSPQQNLFLPFFTDTNFPDVRFFSQNNILEEQDESGSGNYQYGYNEFGNMTSMIQPDGSPVYFRYIGCEN